MTSQYIAIRDDAGLISKSERDFILSSSATTTSATTAATTTSTTTRIDGRKPFEQRPVQLQLTRTDNLATCTVLLGGTSRVTCSVWGELVIPSPDRPNEGSMALTVDISPSASTRFRQVSAATTDRAGASSSFALPLGDRHQKLLANHILRCLESCLISSSSSSSSQAFDTEALCVISGQYVWKLHVSVTVLDHGGNLVDASFLASMAALRHYRKPAVDTTNTNNNNLPVLIPAIRKEPTPLPLHHTPLSLTFAILMVPAAPDTSAAATSNSSNRNPSVSFFFFFNEREELCETGQLTICMNRHLEICLLDVSAGCEIALSDVRTCHNQAAQSIKALSHHFETTLEEANEKALEERLVGLQKQQRQQQTIDLVLPPLPTEGEAGDVEPPPPPSVPYFVRRQPDAGDVPMDPAQDQMHAETAEQEAYRRQALDYNVGHVASKVREDDERKAAARDRNSKKNKSSWLLQAMLQSVSGGGGDDPSTAPEDTSAPATRTEGKLSLSMQQQQPPLKEGPRSSSSSRKESSTAREPPIAAATPSSTTTTKNSATDPVRLDTTSASRSSGGMLMDSDDEDEPATTELHSEFQSVLPASNSNDDATKQPTHDADDDKADEDGVDDLTAAIKKKKKKKKKVGKKK